MLDGLAGGGVSQPHPARRWQTVGVCHAVQKTLVKNKVSLSARNAVVEALVNREEQLGGDIAGDIDEFLEPYARVELSEEDCKHLVDL